MDLRCNLQEFLLLQKYREYIQMLSCEYHNFLYIEHWAYRNGCKEIHNLSISRLLLSKKNSNYITSSYLLSEYPAQTAVLWDTPQSDHLFVTIFRKYTHIVYRTICYKNWFHITPPAHFSHVPTQPY